MGVWGTGLYSNDAAGDIRDACKDFYAFYDIETAHKKIAEYFSEYFEEWASVDGIDNDTASFWYALADWQFSHGVLSDEVKSRTLALLDIYAGLSEWEEDGSAKDVQKRREILDGLKARLLSEPPAPKVPKGRLKKPKHKPGDIFIFKTCPLTEESENIWGIDRLTFPFYFRSEKLFNSPHERIPAHDAHGKYMAILCVGSEKVEHSPYIPEMFDEFSVYAWYDFEGDEKPTVEQLQKCGFLPKVRVDYADFNSQTIESVGWGYTFNLLCESFRGAASYYEKISLEHCPEEADRFERAIEKKPYRRDAAGAFDMHNAYNDWWQEKVRSALVGIPIDTLLSDDATNPEFRPADEIEKAINQYVHFFVSYDEILTENGLSGYVSDEYAEKFERLSRMLTETNEKFNLTAITESGEVILRHFADSLTAVHLIGDAKTVLDVGCGGGFPTLPLAIVRPDVAFTALDATAKKLTFVAAVADALSLPVVTLTGRAEEIGIDPAYREVYDLVISRAVARMNVLCELCLPFVRVGGRFVAMKGSDGMAELDEALPAIEKLGGRIRSTHPLTLGDAGGRLLIEVEKIAPTPNGYPRQFGRIKKKPL